jgi:signal transduction histidine kinase
MAAEADELPSTKTLERLARDLHDGALQMLAAAGLRLETIRRAIPADLEPVQYQLRTLQTALALESAALRKIINKLKPGTHCPPDAWQSIGELLEAKMPLVAEQTQLSLRWSVEPPSEAQLPADILSHVYYLIREAAVNARRHGAANRLDVRATILKDAFLLTLSDDGCGLGAEGQFGSGEPAPVGPGPVSIRERVQDLGGKLTLTSGPKGLRLDIAIPVTTRGLEENENHATAAG